MYKAFLTIEDLCGLFNREERVIRKWIAANAFPKGVKVPMTEGEFWHVDTINNYLRFPVYRHPTLAEHRPKRKLA
ncbi:hypothetical protein [Idiomarina baltica]|uniref:Excisionase n=1 Tax=Idiomarina baltica OS145 TaxID=314276 RepID=A0ABM9WN38_9GAMM|nr:hypothetical protein [Idiomarina baltica]EAQ32315.1 hypothetical protein OS145_07701 [Idiomarina baltica OS145]